MQRAVSGGKPFDGPDRLALRRHCERQARQHPLAVDMHGAGAALPMVAALLGASQVHVLAQCVQQGGAHVHHHAVVVSVDVEHRLDRTRRTGGGRRSGAARARGGRAAKPAAPRNSPLRLGPGVLSLQSSLIALSLHQSDQAGLAAVAGSAINPACLDRNGLLLLLADLIRCRCSLAVTPGRLAPQTDADLSKHC